MATVKGQSNLTYQNSSVKIEMSKVWMNLKFYFYRMQRENNRWKFEKTSYVKAETVEKWILQIIFGISNPTMEMGKFQNTLNVRGPHQTWEMKPIKFDFFNSKKHNIYIHKKTRKLNLNFIRWTILSCKLSSKMGTHWFWSFFVFKKPETEIKKWFLGKGGRRKQT